MYNFHCTLRPWLLIAALCTCSIVSAQKASVFATGFKFPSKIINGPAGVLLVSDMDTPPNSGRISVVDSGGNRRTLIDGLPSGLAVPDLSPDGPSAMAFNARTLYIVIGEGDSHRNGTAAGTIVSNPAGPSSPVFSTVLQVDFTNDIDKLTGGFSLAKQDHFTLADHNPVTLTSGGDRAVVRLLTEFRVDRPDPQTILRNTHLFGIALLTNQPNSIYLADAGNNTVWQVDIATGRNTLLTRFPNTPNSVPGPQFSEAVPTNIHSYDDQLLVSLLSGAPFDSGASRIMDVDPTTGIATTFISLLTSTIDTLYRHKADGTAQWYALEYSLSLPTGAPGRLRVYEQAPGRYGDVIIDGLTTPSSMAVDPARGNLFITDRLDGTVLMANIGK